MEGETPNVVHNLHKTISKTCEKALLTTIGRFEVIIVVGGGGMCYGRPCISCIFKHKLARS